MTGLFRIFACVALFALISGEAKPDAATQALEKGLSCGDPSEALAYLDEAIRLNPKLAQAY